jgi:ribosomal protein L16 Arg81 hydroxylase
MVNNCVPRDISYAPTVISYAPRVILKNISSTSITHDDPHNDGHNMFIVQDTGERKWRKN